MVPMVSNLRHNDLDALVTEENLAADAGEYAHKSGNCLAVEMGANFRSGTDG